MLAEIFTPEQITILTQIIFIDLVLAGDNAIIIGMVASKFPVHQRKLIIFWGHWRCSSFKNNSYIINSLFVANKRSKINRRFIIIIHYLQTLC